MKRKWSITLLIVFVSCIILLAKNPIETTNKKLSITPCNTTIKSNGQKPVWIKIIRKIKSSPSKKVVEIVTIEG